MANKSDEIILKGRLNGTQRNRLVRLLDMLYTPSELANEIGFEVRQVYRVYLHLGCPFTKDTYGRYWINGKEFRLWVEQVYKKRKLKSNEAFCLTCKKPVEMISPRKRKEGRLYFYLCNCPICGRRLAKIITVGKQKNDQSK